jgi:argininosuccinate lyase
MQEDKEAVFDAADTVLLCLKTAVPMLRTMRVNKENMRKAAAGGFINATDCADYLVKKGIPFRDAYKITGELVALCIKSGLTLETLPLEKYREYSPMFAPDVYDAVSLDECVRVRKGE